MSRKHRNHYRSKTRADIEKRVQERELKREFEEGSAYAGTSRLKQLPIAIEPEEGDKNESSAKFEVVAERDLPEKWYVLDTNLILSCVNVLYDATDKNWREPLDFEPDIRDAHLIIPLKVFEELEKIRLQESFEGKAAKIAFKRLWKFFGTAEGELGKIMRLETPIRTGWGNQVISLMPLHKDFGSNLPWAPEASDNDGWIAVTALAATMSKEHIAVDGTIRTDEILKRSNDNKDVVLLTKDTPLLSKAFLYGVATMPYSFRRRNPYTGCRDLTVPVEMFNKFFYDSELTREDFEKYMPDELPLAANEYIIMTPEGDEYPRSYFASGVLYANVARYHKKNGMLYPLRFAEHEGVIVPNAGIATYYDAMNDDKIKVIAVTGEAGTGKTYQAVLHAIKEVREGKKSQLVLVPTKSAKNPLGALPGDKEKKMAPLEEICKNAIASYLASTPEFKKKREELRKYGDNEPETDDAEMDYGYKKSRRKRNRTDFDYMDDDSLVGGFEKTSRQKDNSYQKKGPKPGKDTKGMTYQELLRKETDYLFKRYVVCYPYEEIDGLTFDDAIIIIDEIQRIHDFNRLKTMVARTAQQAKLITCGDIQQINDLTPEKMLKNGINYVKMKYYDWDKFACIYLTEQMRGDVAGYNDKISDEAYYRINGF